MIFFSYFDFPLKNKRKISDNFNFIKIKFSLKSESCYRMGDAHEKYGFIQ